MLQIENLSPAYILATTDYFGAPPIDNGEPNAHH